MSRRNTLIFIHHRGRGWFPSADMIFPGRFFGETVSYKHNATYSATTVNSCVIVVLRTATECMHGQLRTAQHLTPPADDTTLCEWILCFYVIALIGAPMQRTGVFHLRDRELPRQWAGYLLPKASAVTTCIQPNLVRHEICITLKLMFYYVTHYEYYITGPSTLSVKTEQLSSPVR